MITGTPWGDVVDPGVFVKTAYTVDEPEGRSVYFSYPVDPGHRIME
jgi:hypothetical protein